MTSEHINTGGDIQTITPEQAAVLAVINPLAGPAAPMAYSHRGDTTQFIYTDWEHGSIRVVLDPAGSVQGLDLWENDNGTHTGESTEGDWVDVEGGQLWHDIESALERAAAA